MLNNTKAINLYPKPNKGFALINLAVSTSGVETILMFIVSILFAWLVMREYIIATYSRTDG